MIIKQRRYMIKLKELRIKKNLSISELAKMTRILKVTLANLENGTAKSISFDYLNRICYVLGVLSVNEILGYSDKEI